MTNEISQETRVMALKGGVNIYITPEEEAIIETYLLKRLEFFRVRGRLIMRDSLLYITEAKDLEEAMNLKRGMWKCKEKGHWNDRGNKRCSGCYINY